LQARKLIAFRKLETILDYKQLSTSRVYICMDGAQLVSFMFLLSCVY